ncbi:hypothetical protein CJU89_5319 [Yarrowia sp. B02]|nr:hypothetical protein CJU89_5319 [Yarrowia sp. B02]
MRKGLSSQPVDAHPNRTELELLFVPPDRGSYNDFEIEYPDESPYFETYDYPAPYASEYPESYPYQDNAPENFPYAYARLLEEHRYPEHDPHQGCGDLCEVPNYGYPNIGYPGCSNTQSAAPSLMTVSVSSSGMRFSPARERLPTPYRAHKKRHSRAETQEENYEFIHLPSDTIIVKPLSRFSSVTDEFPVSRGSLDMTSCGSIESRQSEQSLRFASIQDSIRVAAMRGFEVRLVKDPRESVCHEDTRTEYSRGPRQVFCQIRSRVSSTATLLKRVVSRPFRHKGLHDDGNLPG